MVSTIKLIFQLTIIAILLYAVYNIYNILLFIWTIIVTNRVNLLWLLIGLIILAWILGVFKGSPDNTIPTGEINRKESRRDSNRYEKFDEDVNLPEYYKLLGLQRNSSSDEIKNAYNSLINIYYPDKSADSKSEEKFIKIRKAYEVLSDSKKRAQYDKFEANYEGNN